MAANLVEAAEAETKETTTERDAAKRTALLRALGLEGDARIPPALHTATGRGRSARWKVVLSFEDHTKQLAGHLAATARVPDQFQQFAGRYPIATHQSDGARLRIGMQHLVGWAGYQRRGVQ